MYQTCCSNKYLMENSWADALLQENTVWVSLNCNLQEIFCLITVCLIIMQMPNRNMLSCQQHYLIMIIIASQSLSCYLANSLLHINYKALLKLRCKKGALKSTLKWCFKMRTKNKCGNESHGFRSKTQLEQIKIHVYRNTCV